MKVSIVIPTINEALGIQAVLLSLQNLRTLGHELIVSDGGSQDMTVEIARPWVDKIVVGAKGRAIQQNAGAAKANGEWLFFLHADTQVPSDLANIIKNKLSPDLVWGRFNVKLSGSHIFFRIIEKMMNWRSRLTGIATGDQMIFVRRDIFYKIGGFAEIALMEDIEISRRLKRISSPNCFSDEVITSSKRWEKKGIVKTVGLMWWLRLNYFFGRKPEHLQKIYYPNH